MLLLKSNFFLAEFGEIFNLSQTKTPNSERFLAFENLKLDFFNLKNIKLNWSFAAKH